MACMKEQGEGSDSRLEIAQAVKQDEEAALSRMDDDGGSILPDLTLRPGDATSPVTTI